MNDLKFALRMLRRNPGFTIVAILTLGIGIGACASLFSVANDMVINPTSVKDADRTFKLSYTFEKGGQTVGLGPLVAQEFLNSPADRFSDATAYEFTTVKFESDGFIDHLMAYNVRPGFFSFMDAKPLHGRGFSEIDTTAAGDPAIVLGHAVWQGRFGGNKDLIGRSIRLGEKSFTLVGVMPPHFRFPEAAECWLPLGEKQLAGGSKTFRWQTLVKAAPEFSQEQTRSYLESLVDVEMAGSRRVDRPIPRVEPLRAMFVKDNLEPTVWALSGAVGLLLLIVWANMGNLMLARAEGRNREILVRGALGADRLQIARLLLTETFILGAAGGAVGLLVCHWAVKPLSGLAPRWAPQLRAMGLDWHVFGIGLGFALATAIAIGVIPSWRAGRRSLSDGLGSREQGGSGGITGSRLMKTLVVGEMALAVALVSGAGLIVQSVQNVLRVDPGYDPTLLVRVRADLPREAFAKPGLPSQALTQMADKISALPGVEQVAYIQLGQMGAEYRPEGTDEPIQLASQQCSVGEHGLFKTMRAVFVEGRDFEESDRKQPSIIVTEPFARKLWPGQRAVGKRLFHVMGPNRRPLTVVGVVKSLQQNAYFEEGYTAFYRPESRHRYVATSNYLMVRTRVNPGSLTRPIQEELRALAPGMGLPNFQILEQRLYDSTLMERTFMLYLVIFAAVGLFLAALGIFGLLAMLVSRRTHEFGVRMSVGANRRDILRLVLSQGLRMTIIGVAVGLVITFGASRWLESLLFGIAPNDPYILSVAIGILAIAALLACYFPARRAANIHPMEALRHE